MTKKQTAVDWLEEALAENLKQIIVNSDSALMESLFVKARAIQKQQHKETWFDSTLQFDNSSEMTNKKLFEQYYKETYES